MKNTGLTIEEVSKINSVFSKHGNIEKVLLYGSRALGTYKLSSDIDLTLVGRNITLPQLYEMEHDLDYLLLPYKIDLSIFEKIENKDLIDHIRRVGLEFYKK